MGTSKLIYDSNDLTHYSDEMIKKIDKAILAAAFHIRDNMRQAFISGSSIYKYRTGKLDKLAEGIQVGKMNDSKVKIHALGSKDFYDSYKTRFFVAGTIPRTQTKWRGKNITPFTKGYIKANNAIDTGMSNAASTLNNFIKNVIEK